MRKYNLNENFFNQLNEKSSYWLGFLYADGCVRMKNGRSGELKLKLKSTDVGHMDKFLEDLESNTPIRCGVNEKDGSKYCYVLINSNLMIKKLFELGCVQNKTFKIRLPKLNNELMGHFIRGYFDGDGSISKVKNRPNSFVVTICSNKNFNKDLIEYMKLGKIYEKKNYSVIYINKLSEIQKFKKFIYDESSVFLHRKFNVFSQINDDYKRDYSTTKNNKTYKLTNINGLVIISNNLKSFCDNNGLGYSTMSNLSRGIGITSKGWKCELLIND
jgi:hypothetical protein